MFTCCLGLFPESFLFVRCKMPLCKGTDMQHSGSRVQACTVYSLAGVFAAGMLQQVVGRGDVHLCTAPYSDRHK